MEMEIIKDGYSFSINHLTEYDNYTTVEINFEYTPIGYFSRYIDTVSGVTIRDESDLEKFAEEWIENRKSFE